MSDVRDIVLERSGYRCELCYTPLTVTSLHHRKPRQMGGTKKPWINDPENFLALCGTGTTGCHGLVEANRETGYTYGWLIRTGHPEADIPTVPHITPYADLNGRWWLLVRNDKTRLTLPYPTDKPQVK